MASGTLQIGCCLAVNGDQSNVVEKLDTFSQIKLAEWASVMPDAKWRKC